LKGKVHFIVVYNLTRFAREKYDHFVLRAHLKSLGISLRSATEPIDAFLLDHRVLGGRGIASREPADRV
jgi:hypothetical protein